MLFFCYLSRSNAIIQPCPCSGLVLASATIEIWQEMMDTTARSYRSTAEIGLFCFILFMIIAPEEPTAYCVHHKQTPLGFTVTVFSPIWNKGWISKQLIACEPKRKIFLLIWMMMQVFTKNSERSKKKCRQSKNECFSSILLVVCWMKHLQFFVSLCHILPLYGIRACSKMTSFLTSSAILRCFFCWIMFSSIHKEWWKIIHEYECFSSFLLSAVRNL